MKMETAGSTVPQAALLAVIFVAAVGIVVAFALGVAFSRDSGPGNNSETVVPITATSAGTSLATSPTSTQQVTATATSTATPTAVTPTATPTVTSPVLHVGGKAVTANLSGDRLNVRSGPGTVFQVIASLREGEAVSLTSESVQVGDYRWWEVRLIDGTVGWSAQASSDGSEQWLLPIETEPFSSVAVSVQRALEDSDAGFFWRSAQTSLVRCTAAVRFDVYACVGQPEDALVSSLGVANPFEGTRYGQDQYLNLLRSWFAATRPDLVDGYGGGGATLYATALSAYPDGTVSHFAIVTAIRGGSSTLTPKRHVLVFTWQLVEGHWRHTRLWVSEGFWDEGRRSAVSWLSGSCGTGDEDCLEWRRWSLP